MNRLACASAALLLVTATLAADRAVDVEKKETLTEGTVTVTLTDVIHDKFSRALDVRFTFRNADRGKRVDLSDAWIGRLRRAGLVDDRGDACTFIAASFVDADGMRIDTPVLFPGRTARAAVWFQPPPKDAAALTLEIPGPDDESTVRFKIPGKFVKK